MSKWTAVKRFPQVLFTEVDGALPTPNHANIGKFGHEQNSASDDQLWYHRRDAAGEAEWFQVADHADHTGLAQTVANAGSGVYNVLDYGATGDGVTDDTVEIQDAIDAAQDAGGGVVYFPAGTYLVSSANDDTLSSYANALAITADNITLRGVGRKSIIKVTDQGAASNGMVVIMAAGQAKAAGSTARLAMLAKDVNLTPSAFTSYAISAATKGQATITLSTPAQHSNFAVGDVIYIRTGQTIPGGTEQPDAEINVITAKDAGTGVLSLQWPTAKPYAQEYFISGTSGITSTSVTANLALFGIQNIDAAVLRNVAVEDLHFDVSFASKIGYCVSTTQVLGVRLENVTGDLVNASLQGWGPIRDVIVAHDTVTQELNAADDSFLQFDRGCSDILISGSRFTSTGTKFSLTHCNEGVANLKLVNSELINNAATYAGSAFPIQGRGYDISILGSTIRASGAAAAVGATTGLNGLTIDGSTLQGPSGGISLSLDDCRNVSLGVNDYGDGHVALHPDLTYGAPKAPLNVYQVWVYHDSASTVTMGRLPKYSMVVDVQIWVAIAFNGGAPTIAVGNVGFPNVFCSAASLSAQGFPAIVRTVFTQQNDTGDETVVAWFTDSASSAGKALVTVLWTAAPVD